MSEAKKTPAPAPAAKAPEKPAAKAPELETVKLDSNIALPDMRRAGRSIYPFAEMKVGQSFFVGESQRNPKSVMTAASAIQKKIESKFVTRTVTENGKAGVRVWRTA